MIIALKGTIGTGKSTLANELKKKGYTIVNCDDIVHYMYRNDQELVSEISNHFEIKPKKRKLSKKFKIDRKELGKVVFNDPVKMEELEAIVHPRLKMAMEKEIGDNKKVVIDCQVVDKLELDYDLAILLTSELQTIVERVKKRDNKEEELIKTIVRSQMKKEVLKTRTYAIDSTNGIEYVMNEVAKIKELKHD